MSQIGFILYLLFTASWFLHLPARFPILGTIRFDLVLVILISLCICRKNIRASYVNKSDTSMILTILVFYVFASLPFVEWPGSVIRTNFENFLKAFVFYYFSVSLLTAEDRLKKFVAIFLMCQSFRIFEPLYLHLTEGYWGSYASMRDWEYMDRLAGSPHDIVNPNGLAFIIVTVIPLIHYLSSMSLRYRILYLISLPVFVYTLILTASRSGFVAFIVILLSITIKSRKRVLVIGAILTASIIVLPYLGSEQRDRFFSIFDKNAKNYGTTETRITGIEKDFELALRRPMFGHGLGTSLEVLSNYGGEYRVSHNLYSEIAMELGFVGLVIFVLFIRSIFVNVMNCMRQLTFWEDKKMFLSQLTNGIMVWLIMNIIFSFASYGLSSYEWYLFGGLSVVVRRLSSEQ